MKKLFISALNFLKSDDKNKASCGSFYFTTGGFVVLKGFRHILEYVLTSQVQEHGSHEHSIFPLKISFAVVLAGDVSDGAGTNPAGIPLGRKQIAVGISYGRGRGSVVNDNRQSAVPFEPGHCPDVWLLLANAGFQRIFQQVSDNNADIRFS